MVMALLEENNAGGILFVGSPGTGKSWYARNIGILLADGERSRFREIQFHQSYQYDDFVEGYVPEKPSGFDLRPKHLLQMAEEAGKFEKTHVLVIDEFSRTDPARVMGEAMTYIDPPMRGKEFSLRSGNKAMIPRNLVLFATMNPEDRSVDEIDDAMDRRWAKIRLTPDSGKVRDFLRKSGMPGPAYGPITPSSTGCRSTSSSATPTFVPSAVRMRWVASGPIRSSRSSRSASGSTRRAATL